MISRDQGVMLLDDDAKWISQHHRIGNTRFDVIEFVSLGLFEEHRPRGHRYGKHRRRAPSAFTWIDMLYQLNLGARVSLWEGD